jgi:uncharacterized repeat protein (TIGR01451 family)
MRKLYFLVFGFVCCSIAHAQIVNIPDANFKAKLLNAGPNNLIARDNLYNNIKIDINSDGEIQVSEALTVYYLEVDNANISDLTGVASFQNLRGLSCSANNIPTIDVTVFPLLNSLDCAANELSTLDLSQNPNLFYLYINNNYLTSIDLSSQNYNLIRFDCSGNEIASLNVSNLTNLSIFYCGQNQLSNIDVSMLSHLTDFSITGNQLTSLNLSGVLNIQRLVCADNHLSSIDVTQLQFLREFICSNNFLATLDVSLNTSLEELRCNGNQLTSLDVTSLTQLNFLDCAENLLTTLDARMLTKLDKLYCQSNQLQTLYIKNGINETLLYFYNNPNLAYICADENQVASVQAIANSSAVVVNSYCSFFPGGNYNAVTGNVYFDSENDGCDPGSDFLPNSVTMALTSSANVTAITGNVQGNYLFFTGLGNFTLLPYLENPSFFTISPNSVPINFTTLDNTIQQDYCITPNGIHHDVEIVVIPVERAFAGFDTTYKIVYRNKGNRVESGTVSLAFEDAVMDFVWSVPDVNSQDPNSLNWTYSNLKPFESRSMYVAFNLNGPQETPPLDSGYSIGFTADITLPPIDDIPADNHFAFKQPVVNSFDPNDKTCLEGNTITPEMIGKYVHYMIRFENTGTANAQNIVVKDMIDTSKFDISSLIPLDGSHPFTTRITDTNKVEFIFENIQLPFDDANNDGYVAFKIKTKPTLVVGNTFSNTASIYFDYNAPIITNTATTAIQVLGTDDFDFSNHFTLYPNPANDIVNIKTKDNTTIKLLSIYNTLGQLVLTVTNPTETTDVSDLASGNYFLKINTVQGVSTTRFIKK